MGVDATVKTHLEENCAMIGRWNLSSSLREGKTLQAQPSVETKQKEYAPRLTTGGGCGVPACFSVLGFCGAGGCCAWCRDHIVARFICSPLFRNHTSS